MFFGHENKTEFIRLTSTLNDREFRCVVCALLGTSLKPNLRANLNKKINANCLAELLNDSVFDSNRFNTVPTIVKSINLFSKEILNENPQRKTGEGDDGIQSSIHL